MLVICNAKACKHNQNDVCNSTSVEIEDIEEKENIKFKDKDFMVCKSFEWRD